VVSNPALHLARPVWCSCSFPVAKKKIDPTLGQRVRALREEKGWTQTPLGDRAEMMDQNLARIEQGETEPTRGTVLKLAEALGVTPASFPGDEDDSPERKGKQ